MSRPAKRCSAMEEPDCVLGKVTLNAQPVPLDSVQVAGVGEGDAVPQEGVGDNSSVREPRDEQQHSEDCGQDVQPQQPCVTDAADTEDLAAGPCVDAGGSNDEALKADGLVAQDALCDSQVSPSGQQEPGGRTKSRDPPPPEPIRLSYTQSNIKLQGPYAKILSNIQTGNISQEALMGDTKRSQSIPDVSWLNMSRGMGARHVSEDPQPGGDLSNVSAQFKQIQTLLLRDKPSVDTRGSRRAGSASRYHRSSTQGDSRPVLTRCSLQGVLNEPSDACLQEHRPTSGFTKGKCRQGARHLLSSAQSPGRGVRAEDAASTMAAAHTIPMSELLPAVDKNLQARLHREGREDPLGLYSGQRDLSLGDSSLLSYEESLFLMREGVELTRLRERQQTVSTHHT